MKMKLANLKEQLGVHKKIVVFLVGLALIGIIMGSFFTVILEDSDKSLVREYMQQFVSDVQKGKINVFHNFLNIGLENLFFVLVVWLLGVSVIGIPIILFIYFSKAFVLGFSIASFLLSYKGKGLIYAFLYIFPHQIINFILYILLLNYAITLSLKLVHSFFKKKNIDFKVVMKKYLFILIFVFVFLFITSIYESLLVPKIMQFGLSFFS